MMTEYNSSIVQAVKTQINGILFDSKLEARVFLTLLNYLDQSEIKLQYKVLRYPKSRYYSQKDWRVDFYVPDLNLYVEAKGLINSEIKSILRDLDQFNPQVFDRLIIVGQFSCRIDKYRNLWGIDQFNAFLASKMARPIKPIPYEV